MTTLKLWWSMTEKTWLILRLIFIICGAIAVHGQLEESPMLAVIWCVPVLVFLNNSSDAAPYRAAGLGSREWNLHRRISTSVLYVAGLVAMLALGQWPAAIVLTLFYAYHMWRDAEMPVQGNAQRLQSMIEGTPGRTDDGRFPATVTGQLIYRPLVTAWLWVLAIYVVVGLILWGVLSIWPDATWVTPVLGALTIFVLPVMASLHSDSLDESITMGYSRTAWGRKAALVSLVFTVPAFMLLAGVIFLSLDNLSGLIITPLAIAPIVWLFTFMRAGSWALALGLTAASVGIIALALYLGLGVLPLLIAGLFMYGAWALCLPVLARKTNVHAPDFAAWLGMGRVQPAQV